MKCKPDDEHVLYNWGLALSQCAHLVSAFLPFFFFIS